ncbi:hypothetical protein K438DRAFT_1965877 [Mycena galopus ATCC 62051]|nr:hypothetical protein K438DRAFT_1965877 [Mycena galopus ATCC 62051]
MEEGAVSAPVEDTVLSPREMLSPVMEPPPPKWGATLSLSPAAPPTVPVPLSLEAPSPAPFARNPSPPPPAAPQPPQLANAQAEEEDREREKQREMEKERERERERERSAVYKAPLPDVPVQQDVEMSDAVPLVVAEPPTSPLDEVQPQERTALLSMTAFVATTNQHSLSPLAVPSVVQSRTLSPRLPSGVKREASTSPLYLHLHLLPLLVPSRSHRNFPFITYRRLRPSPTAVGSSFSKGAAVPLSFVHQQRRLAALSKPFPQPSPLFPQASPSFGMNRYQEGEIPPSPPSHTPTPCARTPVYPLPAHPHQPPASSSRTPTPRARTPVTPVAYAHVCPPHPLSHPSPVNQI